MEIWRPLPVCGKCWTKHHPSWPAIVVDGPPTGYECIVCEEPIKEVGIIFVRCRIEWKTED